MILIPRNNTTKGYSVGHWPIPEDWLNLNSPNLVNLIEKFYVQCFLRVGNFTPVVSLSIQIAANTTYKAQKYTFFNSEAFPPKVITIMVQLHRLRLA